jgi:hypothetical protein
VCIVFITYAVVLEDFEEGGVIRGNNLQMGLNSLEVLQSERF